MPSDSAPDVNPEFESVSLTPRRIGAMITYSDQLFEQVPNVDQILTDDFAQALSQQLDYAALLGRGPAQNEPLGLLNNPDTVKPAGPPSWDWYIAAEELADNLVA